MKTINTKRSAAVTITAARWVRKRGGDRIAQENAAITAKKLLRQGKSAASAIYGGVKAGMAAHNNPLLRHQAT